MPFSRERPTLSRFLTVACFAVAVSLVVTADYQATRADRVERDAAELNASVLRLFRAAGYGGFIHNFKNYILRPDQLRYRIAAGENLETMLAELDIIEAIGADVGATYNLDPVRDVLAAYAASLAEADRLVLTDMTAREIDVRVYVDDTPAVGVVDTLTNDIRTRLADARRKIDLWNTLSSGGLAFLMLGVYAALGNQVVRLKVQRARLRKGHATD